MAFIKGQPFKPTFRNPSTDKPLANGSVEFYRAGTTTPTPFFLDINGTEGGTSLTLNAAGKPQTDILYESDILYKMVVKDVNGVTVETIDNYAPSGADSGQGPAGPPGPQGPQGPTGAQGATGPTGPQGPQGIQGQQGVQGDTGLQGPQGEQGPQGATGPQGPQGPQGVTGEKGDAGTSFEVDEVGPEANRANFAGQPKGFAYLSTDHVNSIGTGSLFVKASNTSGDWHDPIPFGVGPEGPQGPQGIVGPQGPQGLTGPQGPQGLQGPDGNQGPQGDPGIQGPQGDIGPQGPAGPQGPQGPTGSQGIRGSRSYYSANRTSWSVTVANSVIPDTPLENDVVTQYDAATGFSESRVFTGGTTTDANNWTIVDRSEDFVPVIMNGTETAFDITAGEATLENVIIETIQTAKTGARVEINKNSNTVDVYWEDGASGSITKNLIMGTDGASAFGDYAIQIGGDGYQDFGVAAQTDQAKTMFYGKSAGGGTFLATAEFHNLGSSDSDRALELFAPTGAYVTGTGVNGTGVSSGGGSTGYDFYARGSGTNYGPFTGAHDALLDQSATGLVAGDIVKTTGVAGRSSLSNVIFDVELQDVGEAKDSLGVMVSRKALPNYDAANIAVAALSALSKAEYEAIAASKELVAVNGVGEGQINVCSEGGNIEIGDLISSSGTPGKGKLYSGTDLRLVVARALESVDWSAEPESTKQIGCIYLCG